MGKKIRGIPWGEIKAAYLKGEGSMRELAERFKSTGVTHSAVRQHAKQDKWRKTALALQSKVTQVVEKEVTRSMAEVVKEMILKKYPPELWAEQLSRTAGFDLTSVFEVDKDTHETKLRKDWCSKAKGVLKKVKVRTLTTEEGMVIQQVELEPHSSMEAHERVGKIMQYEPDKAKPADEQQNVQIKVTLPPWSNIFGIPKDMEVVVDVPPEQIEEKENK